MTKRPTPHRSNTRADGGVHHATAEGTARYEHRVGASLLPDHFRDTEFGVRVSSVGIGTYLGESDDEDDRAYERAIQLAIQCGLNLIDTAINYRSQRSEQAVGRAIQAAIADGIATRDELVVCTKGGYIPFDRTPPATREEYRAYVKREFFDPEILHPEDAVGGGHSMAPRFLRYCLAKSRQNLGLRTIDVYYLHNPGQQLGSTGQPEWRRRLVDAFGVLEEAASRGEIGVYGVATWDGLRVPPADKAHLSLEDLVAAAREVAGGGHRFRVVQLPINLAMNEAARIPTQSLNGKPVTVLEAADALGLDVVASATLMQSRLASGLPDEVRRHLAGYETDAQRAIAFTRGLEGVTAALVGMKRAEHVNENLRTVAR